MSPREAQGVRPAGSTRPLWLRLLIAAAFFVMYAVILLPAGWAICVYFALVVGGATLGGPGEAARDPTAEWFNPVAYTFLGVIILFILFKTWKAFRRTGNS